MSDVGCRMSDVGCRMSDVGCRMSDVGCRMSDVRRRGGGIIENARRECEPLRLVGAER